VPVLTIGSVLKRGLEQPARLATVIATINAFTKTEAINLKLDALTVRGKTGRNSIRKCLFRI
jgi:hypothetical protein